MERRAFLRASALAVLGACATRNSARIDVFAGGSDYVAGIDNYVAFATSGVTPSAVTVQFSKKDAAIAPMRATDSIYTVPDPGLVSPTFYTLDVRFPSPGVWRMDVDAGRARGTTHVQVRAPSDPGPPIPGARAVPVATPTVRAHHGVDPICTRAPACPFHEVSLDDALRARAPVAFFVGSPKFCTSRTCGPNLEELIAASSVVRAAFIHAEVHPDGRAETIRRFLPSPAFAAWRLPSEPWLFLIGSDGRVRARFEGPLSKTRVRAALARLR